MAYKYLDKDSRSGVSVSNKLAEELHKYVTKKIQQKKDLGEISKLYLNSKLSQNGIIVF